jgi:hypothetical protein
MSRPRRRVRKRISHALTPEDLFDYAPPLDPSPQGRPPAVDLSGWKVTDDWPERVPVTRAEVDVFEAHFSDFFDEWFGPRH